MANAISESHALIASHDGAAIASRLLLDGEQCDKGLLPTPLAGILPPGPSLLTSEISSHLASLKLGPDGLKLHREVKALLYESLRGKILRYVEFLIHRDSKQGAEEESDDFERLRDWKGLLLPKEGEEEPLMNGTAENNVDEAKEELDAPTQGELETAMRVLKYKIAHAPVHSDTARVFSSALELLLSELPETQDKPRPEPPNWKDITARYESTPRTTRLEGKNKSRFNRSCYICRYKLEDGPKHPTYPGLCSQCAEFNIAGSAISLPDALDLSGRNSLVTGARVNLGYHTALRLLRCGAKVIATSRYPWDALSRYSAEEDFDTWSDRLKVVGADFRSAADAFGLVTLTKKQLDEWGGVLDILINNAAQTLTDSVDQEDSASKKEENISDKFRGSTLVLEGSYKPRLRGGGPLKILGPGEQKLLEASQPTASTQLIQETQSSWLQSLTQIPYADVISAHSVNTFVPLILIRELLPLMGSLIRQPHRRPLGYIINVSSREGIFEHATNHSHKNGRHVHTNMSKAALNMITETEAAGAWRTRRVGMNTVDPGYMSAAPEFAHRTMPIGWEDGAARVLWPVAVGEREGMCVWGRFLKHFGATEVDVGAGR